MYEIRSYTLVWLLKNLYFVSFQKKKKVILSKTYGGGFDV